MRHASVGTSGRSSLPATSNAPSFRSDCRCSSPPKATSWRRCSPRTRAGVVAALLLAAAGTPHDVIAAEYALTDARIEALRPRLLEGAARYGLPSASYARRLVGVGDRFRGTEPGPRHGPAPDRSWPGTRTAPPPCRKCPDVIKSHHSDVHDAVQRRAGWCSASTSASTSASVDRVRQRPTALVPGGRTPRGRALARSAARAGGCARPLSSGVVGRRGTAWTS